MISKICYGSATVIALAGALACGPVMAQAKQGTLYSYHTSRIGNCPGLDWHIILEPNNTLSGFVAWDQMKHMARLEGSINQSRNFELDAKEVGGTGRTATIKGNAAGDYITAMIENSGTACDGKQLNIPRVVGGMEGGGG